MEFEACKIKHANHTLHVSECEYLNSAASSTEKSTMFGTQ